MNAYPFILGWYLLASIITFAAYGIDKRAAARNTWRIGEKQLHLYALLGGFPGAWLAQRTFRHKNRKERFMLTFYATAALHIAGWSLWLWFRYGR